MVAIRIGELPDSTMQAIRVGQVRQLVCASPAYLAAHGIPLTPEDLHQHAIVSASSVTPNPEWRLVHNGEPRTVCLQARMTTTTNDSAVAAVVGGYGVTWLLSYQVAGHLRDGLLKTVLTAYEAAPQRVRAFIDLAVERLRAESGLQ